MNTNNLRTVSGVLNLLVEKGFTSGFKMEHQMLKCLETGKSYRPEDLRIVEYHRFEGKSNPADMSVVFAVQGIDGEKGTVISSYGTYADKELINFMDRIEINERTAVTG